MGMALRILTILLVTLAPFAAVQAQVDTVRQFVVGRTETVGVKAFVWPRDTATAPESLARPEKPLSVELITDGMLRLDSLVLPKGSYIMVAPVDASHSVAVFRCAGSGASACVDTAALARVPVTRTDTVLCAGRPIRFRNIRYGPDTLAVDWDKQSKAVDIYTTVTHPGSGTFLVLCEGERRWTVAVGAR